MRGRQALKKTFAIMFIMLISFSLLTPAATALDMPGSLSPLAGVKAENLIVEEFQYRTLIYYTVGDEVVEVLTTQPTQYGALTLEGRVYVQFSVDNGDWKDFKFTAYDEDGNMTSEYHKKISSAKNNAISVLNLMLEQERLQLPEGTYYYDEQNPENSYILTEEHSFRFRVRVELVWTDLHTSEFNSVTSPWSSAVTAQTTVTEETLPEKLKIPVVEAAVPLDAEGTAATQIEAVVPLQIQLVDKYLKGIGEEGILLNSQVSFNNGDWEDMQVLEKFAERKATFLIPEKYGIKNASMAKVNNIRMRFSYSAAGRELNSDWSEPISLGEYIEQSENPQFEEPSFLMNTFLGLKILIWMLIGSGLILIGLIIVVIKTRR